MGAFQEQDRIHDIKLTNIKFDIVAFVIDLVVELYLLN